MANYREEQIRNSRRLARQILGAAALLLLNAAIILLLNASKASAGFLGWLLSFIRWLGEAPLNLVVFLAGIAAAFAIFDWLLTRRAPITAATA